ncbi:MAG: hypothetical protein V4558_08820 [Gemmatimonadota bacterium]
MPLSPGVTINADRENLSALSFVSVSKTGTIAVGQPQDSKVRFFSSTGTSLGTFGRSGGGPGEFGYLGPTISVWTGDSLWVGDNALQRWTLIGPDRALVKTVRVPVTLALPRPRGTPVPVGGIYLRGVVSADTVLAIGTRVDAQGRYFSVAVRMRLDGTPVSILGEALSDASRSDCTMLGSSRPGLAVAVPYCPRSQMVFSPSGDRVAITSLTLEQQSRGAFTLHLLGETGDTLRSREYIVPTERLDSKEFDEIINALPAQVSSGLKAAKAPDRYPPASALLIGWDGSIWVGQEGKSDRLWVIIDPAGREAGQFHLPKNVRLWTVGNGRVWGVAEAESGAQSIVSYIVTWRR